MKYKECVDCNREIIEGVLHLHFEGGWIHLECYNNLDVKPKRVEE